MGWRSLSKAAASPFQQRSHRSGPRIWSTHRNCCWDYLSLLSYRVSESEVRHFASLCGRRMNGQMLHQSPWIIQSELWACFNFSGIVLASLANWLLLMRRSRGFTLVSLQMTELLTLSLRLSPAILWKKLILPTSSHQFSHLLKEILDFKKPKSHF